MEYNHQLAEEKKLVHIKIYEQLYEMIKNGTFPVGSRLPAEQKLSAILGVSRVSLRKALGLLHDDGLLQKVQGAGNFVLDGGGSAAVSSLETLGHPVYKCCKVNLDHVDIKFKLDPSNEYLKKLLGIDTPVVIAIDTWYRSAEELAAYTFGVMAVEQVAKYGLDLNQVEAVNQFISAGVYEVAQRSSLTIYPDAAGISILEDSLRPGTHVTMILEKIYGKELNPIICNKHYIVTENASFEIQSK